jgi:hypothetical protein
MAWRIDRDYIDAGRVGVGTKDAPTGETIRWRVLDDDGEVYYGGIADADAATNDDAPTGLYGLLQWAMHDAGAVDLQVHPADGIKYGLTSADYVERVAKLDPTSNEGWVSIYG